jgi:sugar (pentulose or hexulose) kinase
MLALGVDFGTSGARALLLGAADQVYWQQAIVFPAQVQEWPWVWQQGLITLLEAIPPDLKPRLGAIALDGTSGTVLLCDAQGSPQAPPRLYSESFPDGFSLLGSLVPPNSAARSSSSSLSKLLSWRQQFGWRTPPSGWQLLHQADWLAAQLHGRWGISDWHNALKLGYDPAALAYPTALRTDPTLAPLLPTPLSPGQVIGSLMPSVAERFGLPSTCQVCAGTTDSIAAFLASGATAVGEAVTSLGSTLVLKLLSQQRVDDSRYGIYSHRLGDRWLVGGASNAGGAVLKQFFQAEDLVTLSRAIDPSQPTGLDYYPLPGRGERFPIHDPNLEPRLRPRPTDPVQFLQGLLEGLSRIEAEGYRRLQQLGASPLQQVWTAGGGAQNLAWQQLRAQALGVPVAIAPQTEAAYGVARLVLQASRTE